MGTGQMMLSIMALVLLGTTIFSVNSNTLNQGTILRQTELGIYAVSLATSYIQKAKSMDYDENTIAGLNFTLPMVNPTAGLLTSVTNLGKDAGEILNSDDSYDDFDDYRNYDKDTTVTGVDRFRVKADVYYVSQITFTKTTAAPTWLKQLDIRVNSTVDRNVFTKETSGGVDTIKMSFIYSCYK